MQIPIFKDYNPAPLPIIKDYNPDHPGVGGLEGSRSQDFSLTTVFIILGCSPISKDYNPGLYPYTALVTSHFQCCRQQTAPTKHARERKEAARETVTTCNRKNSFPPVNYFAAWSGGEELPVFPKGAQGTSPPGPGWAPAPAAWDARSAVRGRAKSAIAGGWE